MSLVVLGLDVDTWRVAFGLVGWTRLGSAAALDVGTVVRRERGGGYSGCYFAGLVRVLRDCGARGGFVCVERPFVQVGERKSVEVFGQLSEVVGEVELLCRELGLCVERVSPGDWQFDVLGESGPRRRVKRLAVAFGLGLTGRASLTEHESDALCVGYWGLRYGAGEGSANGRE